LPNNLYRCRDNVFYFGFSIYIAEQEKENKTTKDELKIVVFDKKVAIEDMDDNTLLDYLD
jgi:hypothetical protein